MRSLIASIVLATVVSSSFCTGDILASSDTTMHRDAGRIAEPDPTKQADIELKSVREAFELTVLSMYARALYATKSEIERKAIAEGNPAVWDFLNNPFDTMVAPPPGLVELQEQITHMVSGKVLAAPKDGNTRGLLDLNSSFFPTVFQGALDVFTPTTLRESGGAGVSFEQALIEGTTAFIVDRAKADLVRSALETFTNELGESYLAGAFPMTLQLGGFGGPNAQAYRDPRVYLPALQGALTSDFDALPSYLTSSLKNSDAFGLEKHHWELADRTLGLIRDVQRGTNPLLALTTFSATKLTGADPALQQRLYELHALANALYAGTTLLGDANYSAAHVLDTLEGRRLLAVYMGHALKSVCTEANCASADCDCPCDVDAIQERVVSMRRTLEEITREVQRLRTSFAEIRATSPDEAATAYADYVAVVTRAVRLTIVAVNADPEQVQKLNEVLTEVERVLKIREAVLRRDYGLAATLSLPYLRYLSPTARLAAPFMDAEVRRLETLLEESSDYISSRKRLVLENTLRDTASLVNALSDATKRFERLCGQPSRLCSSLPDSGSVLLRNIEAAQTALRSVNEALDLESTFCKPVAYDSSFRLSRQKASTCVEEVSDRAEAASESLRRLAEAVLKQLDALSRSGAAGLSLAAGTWLRTANPEHEILANLLISASTLAAANSAEGVYDALVVVAAPPGAFRERRGTYSSGRRPRGPIVALSTYLGLNSGAELVQGDLGLHAGLSLPIGVEITWPVRPGRSTTCIVCSSGIMLSPINLGTYLDYRATDTGGTEGLGDAPAYTLRHAFAPSAYVTFGLTKNHPVTIGMGYAYVPGLRVDTIPEADGGSKTVDRDAHRFSIFAAIDVPLYLFR